jgi:hypothetical protein
LKCFFLPPSLIRFGEIFDLKQEKKTFQNKKTWEKLGKISKGVVKILMRGSKKTKHLGIFTSMLHFLIFTMTEGLYNAFDNGVWHTLYAMQGM